jgi:molybdenum cofactor guanylyltransferase
MRELLPLPVSGIILCGGKSSRMGRQKAFLPYGGTTMIEHRLNRMQGLFSEVFLVTNQPEDFSHISSNVVKDIVPEKGPLAGILSGLLVSIHEHCFVVPCDMPLLDDTLIRAMVARRKGVDMLLYQHDNVVEPLVGVYSRRATISLEQALFRNDACTENLTDGLKIEIFSAPRRDRDAEFPPHFDVDTAGDYGKLIAARIRR